jgi:hypothetical protein
VWIFPAHVSGVVIELVSHAVPNSFLQRIFELLAKRVNLVSALLQVLPESTDGTGEGGTGVGYHEVSGIHCGRAKCTLPFSVVLSRSTVSQTRSDILRERSPHRLLWISSNGVSRSARIMQRRSSFQFCGSTFFVPWVPVCISKCLTGLSERLAVLLHDCSVACRWKL